jgi:hypothetical protein
VDDVTPPGLVDVHMAEERWTMNEVIMNWEKLWGMAGVVGKSLLGIVVAALWFFVVTIVIWMFRLHGWFQGDSNFDVTVRFLLMMVYIFNIPFSVCLVAWPFTWGGAPAGLSMVGKPIKKRS